MAKDIDSNKSEAGLDATGNTPPLHFWNVLRGFGQHRDGQPIRVSKIIRLYPYVKPHLRKVLISSLLMIFASALAIPSPYLLKYTVDNVIPTHDITELVIIVILILVLGFTSLAINIYMNYSISIVSQEMLFSLKVDVLQRLLKFPTGFFDQQQTGYLMSRVQEVQSLDTLFSSSTARLIAALLQFVLSLSVMFYLHWKLTVITLITLPMIYWLMKSVSITLQSLSREFFEDNAAVSDDIQETLSGIATIKDFAAEEQHMKKISTGLRRLLSSTTMRNIFMNISNDVIMWAAGVIAVIVFGVSVSEIIAGRFTIGGYIGFIGYLNKLLQPIQIFASINMSIQPAMIALSRIIELLDTKTEEENASRNIAIRQFHGDIRFEDVSFSYDGEHNVLSHFNCHVRPGESVALIGPSGSGKTTIIRLLLGLYNPTCGRILIDGYDLNKLVLSGLREQVGIVSQNIFLFDNTIRDNIRYSQAEADENRIIRAAQAADAHQFIMAMPENYNTVVGERGIRLSGGQMQRIALARAILKNPSIIILDEATSYVDEGSEQKIFSTINSNFEGKTRIIISHRLCSAVKLDQIIRLHPS